MAARAQIRDVAARAGVSIGTVSNVINGLDSVKPGNVKRVEKAMAELGFVPNANARQLRTGRGDAIALIAFNVSNPFFADIAHAAEVLAEEQGSSIVIGSSDQDPAREDRFIDLFETSRARGLLVAPVSGATPRLREAQRRGTPVVLLHEDVPPDEFCSVTLDGHGGGYLASRHLLDLGRRRIALVGGPTGQIAARVSGASRAIQETPGAFLSLHETADLTVAEGQRAASHILSLDPANRPDAVFAANDLVALGVLQEFILQGVRVPEEIALIGYDNIDFAATAIIPLSSIAQPRQEIAEASLRLLLEEEASGQAWQHSHQQIRLTPQLIARASTNGVR